MHVAHKWTHLCGNAHASIQRVTAPVAHPIGCAATQGLGGIIRVQSAAGQIDEIDFVFAII